MKKFWHWISFLGISNNSKSSDSRVLTLSNQLNFIIFIITFLLTIILQCKNLINQTPIGMGTLRVILLMILSIINLFLNKFGHYQLSRLFLIYLAPFLFVIFPTLTGFVESESFIYYPYVIIAFSTTPQIFYHHYAEKKWYQIAMSYYLILAFTIDWLLTTFTKVNFEIIDIIQDNYIFYKIAILCVFSFISLSFVYLRGLNRKFEAKLNRQNKNLDTQNEELKMTLVQLKSTQQQLIQSEKIDSMGTLTSGIAYEINVPLAKVASGLELLDKTKVTQLAQDNTRITDGVEMIRTGLTESVQVVESMLSFILDDESNITQKNLNMVIDDVIKLGKDHFPGDIPIHTNFELQKTVNVYPDKIQRAILNILNFTIDTLSKSTKAKREIIINTYNTLDDEKEYAVIEFDAIGTYIPERIIKKIFDPYVSNNPQNKSLSLGLSQAYSLILEHKGQLKAENKEGMVCFELKIPLANS